MESKLIVAIDGPAGSGKSTVSKEVAKKLGLIYVDTGAMYRALTLKAVRNKIDLNDPKALIDLAKKTDIRLVAGGDSRLCVKLDGEDVSGEIRTPFVTNNVKYIAGIKGVREEMVNLQRKAAMGKGAVLEGRDIGTIVFPDADIKIYLDASIDERVKRRYKELIAKDPGITIAEVKQDVAARDKSDENRSVGPLKKADDAILIDTTKMTIEEVAESILQRIRAIKR
ncbi:MAG: (d)CMP kinase [Candidatus Omnitrophica bacterium]|nr:(d)CMP kinase [Candidatus Omnitrophota bacterium]MBU4488465.1 (d)CMP kinase [Candidatus Omnitrophota bacterium]MCG2705348.1 (d)CMP kinase [Candidatus Omnitrophota bacterium]